MAAAEKSWPLSKVTDGAHWDAEDIFGHLCIVADAAFLSAVRHAARNDALVCTTLSSQMAWTTRRQQANHRPWQEAKIDGLRTSSSSPKVSGGDDSRH